MKNKKKNKNIQFSKIQLLSVIESMKDLVFVVSAELDAIYSFQSSLTHEFLIDPSEFEGRPLGDLPWPGEVLSSILESFRLVKETSEPQFVIYPLSMSSGICWFRACISPLVGDNGGFVVVVRDVTDMKNARLALEAREKHYQKQSEVLREIAYLQSHTLRGPITNIMSLLDLIDREELSAANKACIERLYTTAQKLDGLVLAAAQKINKEKLYV